MTRADMCYFVYNQEVCDDDCGHEETCVQGYWSGTSEGKFFYDVSKMICFSDCEPRDVVKIVWHNKEVYYRGWQPGMLFEYEDDDGQVVWFGRFPEWDH